MSVNNKTLFNIVRALSKYSVLWNKSDVSYEISVSEKNKP